MAAELMPACGGAANALSNRTAIGRSDGSPPFSGMPVSGHVVGCGAGVAVGDGAGDSSAAALVVGDAAGAGAAVHAVTAPISRSARRSRRTGHGPVVRDDVHPRLTGNE